MFAINSGADDDEDISDNSSIPMSYQYFNPAAGRKSKLGRRRLMQPKEPKNVEEAPKQDTQPIMASSHWRKDDSGILTFESTPSLTHPVSRAGNANFNAKLGAGNFTSTFTPSFKSNQENKFDKFALPSTPRFRSEPLKEINGIDNSANQPGNQTNPVNNPFSELKPDEVTSSEQVAVQKQLNKSFIDESFPVVSSAANKTANETSDFSNDSSFMTCHDVHVQQSNKTVNDPAFLKTPGRNLAEIRIDESPFNPLENFLEESDDGWRKTPVSSVNNNNSKIRDAGPNEAVNVDESRYSDPLAFPLDCSNVDVNKDNGEQKCDSPPKPPSDSLKINKFDQYDMHLGSNVKIGKQDSEADSQDRAYSGTPLHSADDEFKHPSLALLKTPRRADFDQKEEVQAHTTPSSGFISEKSFHTEETTHVTYPQPSKSIHGQKNTFTSQFSLNSYKPGVSNGVKALSLANQGYEPLSAASLRNGHGVWSSHFDQGYGSQSGRMVHRMGNVRDSSAGVDGPSAPSSGQSFNRDVCSQEQTDGLDSSVNLVCSERTVVARNTREPGPGGGSSYDHEDTHSVTLSTNLGNDATVVARESHLRVIHQEQQERNRSHTSNHQPENKQQCNEIQQNRLHPSAQQQQSRLPIMGNAQRSAGPPNRTQFGRQQQSGLHSGGLHDHSRSQFGGQQQNTIPQADVYQDPQRPQFGGQHKQSRPQSAGQMQPNRPNNDAQQQQQQQNRPHSVGQQQQNRSHSLGLQQSDSLSGPPSENLVLSALIKPQPQNLITVKGMPYTVLSLLGKGGSSQVYQALGPQSSKLMAIKCVNLASVEEAMATDYLNEIALLSKLQGCPSVIKMFDHEYVEQSQMLYVVLEKGDIDFSKLIKNISGNNQISMPMILYYWSEMLNAVHEIHKRGIIHSDLKPANFLLVEGRLKLIDFGIASSIQGDTTSVMKDVPAGTYNYMSPESISGPKITRKSDVWSMGCILFNLLYGRTPFSHLNNRWQKLHAIADVNHPVTFPPLKHHAPPSLRLALRWCLNKDPALRPTVEELVTLSELTPPADSGLGKEIDGMMCQYFRRVLPNLRTLKEDSGVQPSK